MCGWIVREATSSRLIQPKLAPASPPALLVMVRPCHAGTTATRPEPLASLSTTTSVCAFRNATSSANVFTWTP